MVALGLRLALPVALFLLLLGGFASGASSCSSASLGSNRVYATCSDLPHLSASLHWSYDAASGNLSVAFVAPPAQPDGWVAWAINPTGQGMDGAQALIAFRQPDGSMGAGTYSIKGYDVKEGPIAFETSDLAAEQSGGVMRIFAKLKLPSGTTTVNQIWQVGPSVSSGAPQPHDVQPANLQSTGKVDLIRGATSQSSAGSSTTKSKNVHGMLNAVSWGILLPAGAIFARYLKTFKSADPAWFYLHVTCQIIGYGVGVGGWATGLNLGSKSKGIQYTTHRNIGISLFSLATLQVFALFLRPNQDHKYRFYWNIYHHLVGYTVISLGIANVFEGLKVLSIDHKWTVAYIIAICILAAIALFLEIVTWIIALKRKSDDSKPYNGVKHPLSA
ncbi:cytochrome b561 and DOMON domain-containing protein At4g12980-like [Curcuma longa]|uniref:cytochrome b561 and DOMON domain-containing protein At4g12980-like n=1 Tax=Curcuma longa TaxID=136217 RepID=UPI003D9E58CF